MIQLIQNGDLFKSGCEGLVNTVNVVGVMGKGIALDFRRRFPSMFPIYKSACQRRAVQTQEDVGLASRPAGAVPLVINFPDQEVEGQAMVSQPAAPGYLDRRH
jgi:O-acetyl-ADP-ribose deacetylase (regulator of RNase III)